MLKLFIIFSFVSMLPQGAFGQANVEQRLAELLKARDKYGQSPHLRAVVEIPQLASAIGVDEKQLTSMRKFRADEKRKYYSLKEKIKAYQPPPPPPEPDLVGLSKEERRLVSDEYVTNTMLHNELVWNERSALRKKSYESIRQNRLESYESLESVLTNEQKIRYGQVILQSKLGLDRPLGMYFNSEIRDWVRLSPAQFEEMRVTARSTQEKLFEDMSALIEKYHREIRKSLPRRQQELVEATLSTGRDDLDLKPTKISLRFLEPEYRHQFGIPSLCSVFGLYRNFNARELADYLNLEEEQRSVIRNLLSEIRRGRPDNVEPDNWLREFDDQLVDDILLPYQVRRLAQQIAMKTLNDPRPFGVYQKEKFRSVFELSRSEFDTISKRAEEIYPEFLAELTSLLKSAHEKVRAGMPVDVKEQLERVFGEPFMLSMLRKVS